MEIAVDGWMASPAEWNAVRKLSPDELPALSEQQREVARKLGIRAEEYARSVAAGERTREALLAKAQRLGRWLQQRLERIDAKARIERVELRIVKQRFEVVVRLNSHTVPVRIDESLVDDYFDSGSVEAEERLGRVLDRALVSLTA